MKEAGYTATACRDAGFSIEELFKEHYSCVELKKAGCTAKELKRVGADTHGLLDARYLVQELASAGLAAKKLAIEGVTAEEFYSAGFKALDLKGIKAFSPSELNDSGYGFSELWNANLISAKDADGLAGIYNLGTFSRVVCLTLST